MRSQSFWGFLLIAAGIIGLLVQLGGVFRNWSALWPVILIVVGVWLFLGSLVSSESRGLTAGLVAIGMGLVLVGENLSWFEEGLLFPVLVVALGSGMLLRSLLGAKSQAG